MSENDDWGKTPLQKPTGQGGNGGSGNTAPFGLRPVNEGEDFGIKSEFFSENGRRGNKERE